MSVTWKDRLKKTLKIKKNSKELSEKQTQRCDNILNYWLDIELFDLPECPFYKNKEILSIGAEKFTEKLDSDLTNKISSDPEYITKDSRLNIMFQCHRAGYILSSSINNKGALQGKKPDNDYSTNPNKDIPRTYLVSHSFIPKWDDATQQLLWALSTDEQDIIINLATIRTIYRKCPPKTAHNQRFSQWIKLMVEEIETLFNTRFSNEETNNYFTTEQLQRLIKEVNRDLTKLFWPEPEAIDFMSKYCGSLETLFANYEGAKTFDKEDQPAQLKDGSITFRWRFCFYREGNESQQLGPFYVADLEHCIEQMETQGTDGLSLPLRKYLLGHANPTFIPTAANNGELFHDLTKSVPLGRWPENPKYGLSLLQKVAVNVALDNKNNPIVAVNGPPGTGKTTLLKDVIATKFVERTYQLSQLIKSGKFTYTVSDDTQETAKEKDSKSWFTSNEARQILMSNSIIVASSNNKAVENISKELPAKSSIDAQYLAATSHFRHLAAEEDWGLFCAVLGNSSNRKTFKSKIGRVHNQLRYSNDTFYLNQLVKLLKSKAAVEEKVEVIRFITEKWQAEAMIPALVNDFEQCSNRERYKSFYNPFITALQSIHANELSVESFISHWQKHSTEEWEEITTSLDAVRKQWFGKKLYLEHQRSKLETALKRFDSCIAERTGKKDWQLDAAEHLIGPSSYFVNSEADSIEAERKLQVKSPYASEKLNDARSRLFCAALALNEAIIETYAADFEPFWSDLDSVIDGTLTSNEPIPYHSQLWSLLFLIFPVVSTSLSSIENQFKLMQKKEGFGVVMIDEAGQAVNYHVTGLLQRCKQAIFVGDPIQLEPVVTIPAEVDLNIANDYIDLADEYNKIHWGDNYVVSTTSAQTIADLAGSYYSELGGRRVGIPLLVHRRCLEPMFSIANKIAYKNKMVSVTNAGAVAGRPILPSGWINVEETDPNGFGYANLTEAEVALNLVEFLVNKHKDMTEGGVFIITPFTQMRKTLQKEWKKRAANSVSEIWMQQAFGKGGVGKDIEEFAKENIGTIHTFQGKEASVVILCLAASEVRKKMGGVKWVNSKPNLLNVAVTRSKHHLFVIGNARDWQDGNLSGELQDNDMMVYKDMDHLKQTIATQYQHISSFVAENKASLKVEFDFGG